MECKAHAGCGTKHPLNTGAVEPSTEVLETKAGDKPPTIGFIIGVTHAIPDEVCADPKLADAAKKGAYALPKALDCTCFSDCPHCTAFVEEPKVKWKEQAHPKNSDSTSLGSPKRSSDRTPPREQDTNILANHPPKDPRTQPPTLQPPTDH